MVPRLRESHPDPLTDLNPETAKKLGVCEGDWVWVENMRGKAKQRVRFNASLKPDTVRSEHGWWFPEQDGEEPNLFGVWKSNTNSLIPHFNVGILGFGAPYKSIMVNVKQVKSLND